MEKEGMCDEAGVGKCQVGEAHWALRRVQLLMEEHWKPLQGSSEGLYLFPASFWIEVK